MENKNELTRREFIKKIVKVSAGAAMFSMLPAIAGATTLSEFKEGKRYDFKNEKPKIITDLKNHDEDMIGSEIVGDEGIMIREAQLNFARKLQWRMKTDAIVIHHVGNTDKNVNSAAIHRWHLKNGWAGIGYHYVIRKDGTIERGRPLHTVGAHCYNQNEHTVGICVIGNFELARPTHEQFRSTEELIGSICRLYQINPDIKTVRGHKDYNRTDCPGTYLYQWIPDIIRNAKKFC